MPQRGYALQPNVAASATLGNGARIGSQPQRGCVICIGEIHKEGATALRLNDPIVPFSQGSRAMRQPWAGGRSPVGAVRTQGNRVFTQSLKAAV
jgi:hypothetical protein